MNDVELEVSRGSLRFRGRGPREWVEAQFAKIFTSDFERRADPAAAEQAQAAENDTSSGSGAADRGKRWMQHHQVTQEQLDHVFHLNGSEIHLIAPALPGGSNKDKCINAYILAGLRSVLMGEEGRFTDDEARDVCTHYGAYDQNNHSRVLNSLKPAVAGGKTEGWRLTAPGMAKAAGLVKQLAESL
jgi:hypothetical protein